VQDKHDLRIVIDLAKSVKAKSFALKPNSEYGHRLVIDLETGQTVSSATASVVQTASNPASRKRVIAIDAGHGGDDSGARGKRGTREKDVVLSIARKLKTLVNKQPGMRAVLIRDGDYFLPLRKRMRKARAANADMFISIHADAFHKRSARGSSVFVLSQRGATSEMARWLAARENAADLVGGVSLDDKDPVLKEVLLDLAQTSTRQSSVEAANYIFKEMKRLGKTHKNRVQKAGFMVLKSPDIPSLLVETAFISNPKEEKRLRSPRHQQKIAQAIMNGVQKYFRVNPNPLPDGVRMASADPVKHKVKRGDTLGKIAKRYDISLKELRAANKMKGSRLLVGKVLKIPGQDSSESQLETQIAQVVTPQKYKIKSGDTLGQIAQRFGVSLKTLRKANGIKGNRLLVGKTLEIPGGKNLERQAETRVAKAKPKKYKVKNGDNLSHIAKRHGVSLKEIRAANNIKGNRLRIGKLLTIPVNSEISKSARKQLAKMVPRKHKVRNGDTLSQIAVRYGVSQRKLRNANKIRGDRLAIGKVLTIPAQDS
jgi:N-acetylmuramoyl-L-alanine amidase